jgi:hypothetical protein
VTRGLRRGPDVTARRSEGTMKIATYLATALTVPALIGAPVQAQTKPECDPAKTPAKVEGQVVKVDKAQNKVSVRGTDGTTHDFQASKDLIKDLKVGDRIEANLRSAPSGC